MRVYDISREVLSAPVYPDDPSPKIQPHCRIEYGDVCNTSVLNLCAHNGTHLDAPLHFIAGGRDIASVELDCCIGKCTVIEYSGVLLGADAEKIIRGFSRGCCLKDMQISPSGICAFDSWTEAGYWSRRPFRPKNLPAKSTASCSAAGWCCLKA